MTAAIEGWGGRLAAFALAAVLLAACATVEPPPDGPATLDAVLDLTDAVLDLVTAISGNEGEGQ